MNEMQYEDLSWQWNTLSIEYENPITDEVSLKIFDFYKHYPLIQYDSEYDAQISSICVKSPKLLWQIIGAKKNQHLKQYLMHCTQLLTYVESISKYRFNVSMRVNWTLNHRKLFPVCVNEKCNAHLMYFREQLSWNEDYKIACGSKCLNQSKYHKQHVADTLFTNYGVDVPAKNPLIFNRMQLTCLERYGVKNIFLYQAVIDAINTPEIKAKQKETLRRTNQKKYGVDWFVQSDEFKAKAKITDGASKEEKEIVSFLKQQFSDEEIVIGSFKIIPPKQLDIYFPKQKIAFEFNGTYYHSIEQNTDMNYHLDKTRRCEQLGIKLIHIWEDEWISNAENIKKMMIDMINGIFMLDLKNDIEHIDRSKFNRCFDFNGYEIIGETLPEIVLRAKKDKNKYRVPDCGKLICKKLI